MSARIRLFLIVCLTLLNGQEISNALTPAMARNQDALRNLQVRFKECDENKKYLTSCTAALQKLENSLKTERLKNKSFLEQFERDKKLLSSQPENAREQITIAWNAWIAALDPHAQIIATTKSEKESAENHILVSGVGARLRILDGHTYVAFVMENSGGEKAGLNAGDEILEVNGHYLPKLTVQERENLFQNVKLPVKITWTRNEKVTTQWVNEIQTTLANVDWHLKRDLEGKYIGELRVRSFTKEDSCAEIETALVGFQRIQVKKIVMDLTNNPGGLVREAQCVAGLLLGPGLLFAKLEKQEALPRQLLEFSPLPSNYANRESAVLRTTGDQVTKIPLEIVINHNTASAAEMLAASLQDNKRAKILGSRSFGKGTMQSLAHPWNDPDLLLSRTTHKILRPSGKALQLSGVIPDLITEKAEGPNFPREENLTQSL